MKRLLDAVLERVHERYREMVAQFVRFGVVGAFNTALDFSIYVALTRGSAWWGRHILLAASVSFSCGVVSSFLLNNFWTFRKDARAWHRRSAKFLVVALAALAWNNAILFVLTRLGMHDILAKLFATGVVTGWNFAMHRTWTFRDR
jgi:putative flippase GtrA